MPPPIRYPVPTMVALLLVGLVAWRGAGLVRGVRAAVEARWRRAVDGPPAPVSKAPKGIVGPWVRRGLLLREDTPASVRPGGKPVETIARRMFVDIWDAWPLDGTPTAYRVGNRTVVGWVDSGDCLEWDTRLVVRPHGRTLDLADRAGGTSREVEVGNAPVPVVGWRDGWLELACWEPARPWSRVSRRGWVDSAEVPDADLGVLLARDEVPALLNLAVRAGDQAGRDEARLAALIGRISGPGVWQRPDLATATASLPERAFARRAGAEASERLAAINAKDTQDASWGGHGFRFVPLADLP